jgi:hypothetical protein
LEEAQEAIAAGVCDAHDLSAWITFKMPPTMLTPALTDRVSVQISWRRLIAALTMFGVVLLHCVRPFALLFRTCGLT